MLPAGAGQPAATSEVPLSGGGVPVAAPLPPRGSPIPFDEPFDEPRAAPRPAASGDVVDPLEALGLAGPAQPVRHVPRAEDLGRGSALEDHFRPPAVIIPGADRFPSRRGPLALIPDDYDPMRDSGGSSPAARGPVPRRAAATGPGAEAGGPPVAQPSLPAAAPGQPATAARRRWRRCWPAPACRTPPCRRRSGATSARSSASSSPA